MPLLTPRLHPSATARAWWYRRSWPAKAGAAVTALAAGTLVAASGGYPPLTGTAVSAALLAAAAAWLTASEIVQIAAVLLGYLTLAGPLGFAYTSAALGLGPGVGDLLGGTLNLTMLAVAAAVVAWRQSRGRAWLTLLLALVATVAPGLALLWAFPALGLWWAWLLAGTVLAVRCGAWSWLRSLPGLRSASPPVTRTVEEAATAGRWPEQDPPALVRRISSPGSSPDLDLVVDRCGVLLVAHVRAARRARRHSEHGLILPGEAMQSLGAGLLTGRRRAARLAGVPVRDVVMIVLLEHASNADVDATVGLHPDGSPVPVALVRMAGRARFEAAVSEPRTPRSARWVRRVGWLVDRRCARGSRAAGSRRQPRPSVRSS